MKLVLNIKKYNYIEMVYTNVVFLFVNLQLQKNSFKHE